MYKSASRFLQRRSVHAKGPTHLKSPSKKRKSQHVHVIPRMLWQALKSQDLVQGRICAEVQGGYTITINNYRAFCPQSEMYPRPLSPSVLTKLKYELVEFSVVEIKLQSVIVSRKRAVQIQTWKKIRQSLSDGVPILGEVKEIKSYGAFIDLGGIDGLLHISNIGDMLISDINIFFHRGQHVNVTVLNIDEENKRISLLFRYY